MKKLFLGILIFAIISVSATAILINIKNSSNEKFDIVKQENESGDIIKTEDEENNTILVEKEKTLDLYGRYDENDLKIEEIVEWNDILKNDIEIPVIKGLKNKEVENKINSDIKERILEAVKETADIKKDDEKINSYCNVSANFANVISIEFTIYYSQNDKMKEQTIGLNYELINGERINFEDIFIKNADLHSIVRRAIYRAVSQNEVANEFVWGIEFDKEKEEWLATHWEYTEDGDELEVKKEYIPSLTDYEINKMIKKFLNSDEKSFYFSPSIIFLAINGNSYSCKLYFKDIADEVVIYDKYTTKESLFEESNIGMKNMWTCTSNNNNEYQDYNFAEDNLYYEVIIKKYNTYEEGYVFKEQYEKLKNETLNLANDKIEEYRKIAKENKDKFYVLSLKPSLYVVSGKKETNLISTQLSEAIGVTSIESKNVAMEEILNCYRYYNLGFYESALNLAFNGSDFGGPNSKFSWQNTEEKNERRIYDARNLNELTSPKDVFKGDVDYISILKNYTKTEMQNRAYKYGIYTEEEIQKMIESAKYELTSEGIMASMSGDNNTLVIYYYQIAEPLLTIYDLNMFYIIPESNIRIIEETEIQDLTLDELNKAYNEIFARYGHEFKNAELKTYFEKISWYKVIPGKTVTLEELTEIEKQNLNTIKSIIIEKKL